MDLQQKPALESPPTKTLEDFLRDLDAALQSVSGPEEATCNTCGVLRNYSQSKMELPECLRQGSSECYARHLVHKSCSKGYCVVAMVWGPGQGTAVHDHGGVWCVEGCMEGELKITSYRFQGQSGDALTFEKEGSVEVRQGSVGCLIPPFEHHKIENVSPQKAITIHVYGEELTNCRRFLPREDGLYETQVSCLSYTSQHAAGKFEF